MDFNLFISLDSFNAYSLKFFLIYTFNLKMTHKQSMIYYHDSDLLNF